MGISFETDPLGERLLACPSLAIRVYSCSFVVELLFLGSLFLTQPERLRMSRSILSLLATASLLFAAAAPICGAEADLKDDLAKLQGKWKGTVGAEDNATLWTLENKGNKTKLTIQSKSGNDLAKVECDFKLERHGKFKAYTYSNLKYLSGDKEGQTELTGGKSRSSIYRFDGDSVFHTIGGFREDDEEAPTLIRWEKVKD